MINEVPSNSVNITEQNIDKLKELFPEILTDGNKIDFDKLQLILGEEIDSEKERYSFNWPGKREAIIGAQQPSKGTLRPNVEKSKNFDTTENLYIEGDNLEVLKLLQKSYNNKIKVIYIDPPYNTGKDFVYKDNFRDGVNNYLEQTGQVDSEGNLLSTNSESNGRFHTDWLNMMYPRLKLARNLLTDDGVIFISIDDSEQANLKKMCDEIFGENNLSATFLWTKTSTPPSLSNKSRKTVEYVLAYEKNINNQKYYGSPLENGDAPLLNSGNPIKRLKFNKGTVKFTFLDKGKIEAGKKDNAILHNEIYVENKTNLNDFELSAPFKWVQQTLENEVNEGTYFIVKSNKFSIRFQRKENPNLYKTPTNYLDVKLDYSSGVKTNEAAVKELEKLDLSEAFDYPKPLSLIETLCSMVLKSDQNAIVLDFFSGSSTTAHSVINLNLKDSGDRKFIMIQLPELLNETSNAYKVGFKTISDIGSERIRRAGDLIITDYPQKSESLDIGFKYLTLDKSNIKEWNTDFESLENELDLFADVFVEGRSELDIVYEIMLKNGLELTLPIDEFEVNGRKIYDIAFGHQFI